MHDLLTYQLLPKECSTFPVAIGNMVGLLPVIMEADHSIENDSSIAESSLVVAKSSAFSEANTSIRLKATLGLHYELEVYWRDIWQRGWEVTVTGKLSRLKQEISI